MKASRTRNRRGLVVAAVVVALVCGSVAYAAYPDTGVETYTGCLNVNGTAGIVGKIAVGTSPLRACTSTERLVHFGGGDITKVTAGTGLSGGGDNGAVTINLDAAHSLPQGCGSGQVAKSNGSNVWGCADDNNTTYTAGTGLDLTGGAFSVASDYQLPQSCSDGEFAKRDSGSWVCGTPSPPSLNGLESTLVSGVGIPDDGAFHDITKLTVPSGNYLVLAKGQIESEQNVSDFASTTCRAAGDEVRLGSVVVNDDGGAEIPFTLVGITSTPGGDIHLSCSATSGADGMSVDEARIVAVRIGS